MNSITYQTFTCGSCSAREGLLLKSGSWKTRTYPAGCTLIHHHNEGVFLVDTGYSSAFFQATRPFPERAYRWATPVTLKPHHTAKQRLRQLGVSPKDLNRILLTHLHADHVGGCLDFPDTSFTFHTDGLKGMRLGRIKRTQKGFLPRLLPPQHLWTPPPLFQPWQAELTASPVTADERILLVHLPGHAPGHCGVFIDSDSGPVLLAADSAWLQQELIQPTPITRLAKGILWDVPAYTQTQHRIRELKRIYPDLRIHLSHDPEKRT